MAHPQAERLSIPFKEWPDAHQLAYEHGRIRAASPCDPDGKAAHWRQPTHKPVILAWGLYIHRLARNGVDIEQSPDKLMTELNLECFIRDISARVTSVTRATYTVNVGEALRVMCPDLRFGFIQAAIADLTRAATPQPDERTGKISSSAIYTHMLQRMDRTRAQSMIDKRAALEYLDGAKIAIAVLTGIRLRTLCLATVGHLTLKHGRYEMRFAPAEIKTNKPFVADLPARLTPYVTHAIEVARWIVQSFGDSDSHCLWPTGAGRQMSGKQTYNRIIAATKTETGNEFGPQNLRRSGPTSLQRISPLKIPNGQAHLRHGSMNETLGYMTGGVTASVMEFKKMLGQSE